MKGAGFVIACDRILVLALSTFPIALYQYMKFHLIPFDTFRDVLWSKYDVRTDGRTNRTDGQTGAYRTRYHLTSRK